MHDETGESSTGTEPEGAAATSVGGSPKIECENTSSPNAPAPSPGNTSTPPQGTVTTKRRHRRIAIAVFIVHHPFLMLAMSFGVAAVMSFVPMAMGLNPFSSSTQGTFYARNEEISRKYDAYQEAVLIKDYDECEDRFKHPQRSVGKFFLQILYEAKKGDNVYTRETLEQVQLFEERFLARDEYLDWCQLANGTCSPHISIVPDFYIEGTTELVDDIDARLRVIGDDENMSGGNDFFFDRDFDVDTNRKSTVSRSQYKFGAPLPGFECPDVDFDEQEDKYESFAKDAIDWIVGYDDAPNVDLTYLGSVVTEIEIRKIVNRDIMMVIGSVSMVAIILIIGTGSVFLAILGLVHIFLSFPSALFIYRLVFQYKLYPALNIVALFIIFGIGADDVFIFTDAWKQSYHQPIEICSTAEDRLSWSYRRASKAMLVTTLTTFGAFVATAFSPIPTVSTFGVYSAIVILMNYTLVITWYPAILVLWHRWGFDRLNWKCKRTPPPRTHSKAEFTLKQHEAHQGDIVNIDDYRAIERFYYTRFSPWIQRWRYVIIVFFVTLLVISVVFTMQLGPPEQQPVGISRETNLGQAYYLFSRVFRTSSETDLIKVAWLFGIDSPFIDRGGIDPNDNHDFGKPEYASNWDISHPHAQQWILDACRAVGAQAHLVREGETSCFMEGFNTYLNKTGESIPLAQANFITRFLEYLRSEDGLRYRGEVDYICLNVTNCNKLRWASVTFNTTIALDAGLSVREDAFNEWEDLVDEWTNKARNEYDVPDEAIYVYQTTETWVWMRTGQVIIRVVVQTVAVSLALSFVIMTTATHNIVSAFWATTSIIGVVFSSLLFSVIRGWDLGPFESIAVTILVGISVDFSLHLMNSYNECRFKNRYSKVRHALTEMGISVLGAGLTSIASTFFLFFTYLSFFQIFGQFLFAAIALSLLWSNFYLTAVLLIAGPRGKFGNLVFLYKKFRAKLRKEKEDSDDHDESTTTDSPPPEVQMAWIEPSEGNLHFVKEKSPSVISYDIPNGGNEGTHQFDDHAVCEVENVQGMKNVHRLIHLTPSQSITHATHGDTRSRNHGFLSPLQGPDVWNVVQDVIRSPTGPYPPCHQRGREMDWIHCCFFPT
eukprot:TRINITY_DN4515_c0_g1_i1.p1 TRINITY_DN4515_c0_g1~~TRINITY_DN4515_c0_g1_i1.p1  ORF type:complete len:1112 (+),score=193.04 TRINITY_DN4515_c0_g1_i1:42-3377(+)